MDCRKPLVLFAGLLLGVGGCTSSLAGLRGTGAARDDGDMVHKPSTYVAFGDFRAKSAESPEYGPEQRQQLREEAKLSYLRALELDSKCLEAHVALARLQQSADDFAGAAQLYQRALELAPNNAALWFELGMCQCRLKDWNTALGNLRKAVELAPRERHYATTTGYALARAGQWDEAFRILSQVHGQAKAHYDLARMLRHLGQEAQARQHLTAALTVDPTFTAASELLAALDSGRAAAPEVRQAGHTEQLGPRPPLAIGPRPQIITPSSQLAQGTESAKPPAPPGPLPPLAGATLPEGPAAPKERPIKMPPLPVIKIPAKTP